MQQTRKIFVTDTDEVLRLQTERAQRLSKPHLDGCNSQEPIDVTDRAAFVVGCSLTLFSFLWTTNISGFMLILMVMIAGASIGYILYLFKGNSKPVLQQFAVLVWIGFSLSINVHPIAEAASSIVEVVRGIF